MLIRDPGRGDYFLGFPPVTTVDFRRSGMGLGEVGRTRSAFTTDEKEFELALWERVVRGVAPGDQVESQTGIVPTMSQLNLEHSLGLEDMVDLSWSTTRSSLRGTRNSSREGLTPRSFKM